MNVPQLGFCSSTVWVPTPFICNQSLIKMSFRWAIRFERIFLDLFTAFNDMIILYFIYIYCATKWRNLHASGACSYKSYLRRCCLKHHSTRESAKRMEHYISRHTFNKNRTKQNITVFFSILWQKYKLPIYYRFVKTCFTIQCTNICSKILSILFFKM